MFIIKLLSSAYFVDNMISWKESFNKEMYLIT